ncbi:unnamed protein product, partial [Ixodes hexagonus]
MASSSQRLRFVIFLTTTLCGAGNMYYKSAKPEDFLIGALLPVHQPPHTTDIASRACGNIWEGPGIQRLEAALHIIDEINARVDLLPNSTLGIQIRDTCWYPPIALEQASHFIKLSAWLDGEYVDMPYPYKRKDSDECDQEEAKRNLVAVLGPSATAGAAEVQSLLRLFKIPQIGYSFTGQELGVRERYGYYVSVVPLDDGEVRAMIDLVERFNWTYVSGVFTDRDGASRAGLDTFKTLATERGICVSQSLPVPAAAVDADYEDAVTALLDTPKARVVICFCATDTVRGLLAAMHSQNVSGQFTLVASDAWTTDSTGLGGVEEDAVGSLVLRVHADHNAAFESYYTSLNPSTNWRDPWFSELWETKFQCKLNRTSSDVTYKKRCTGRESLCEDYEQDPKLDGIRKGIYLVAHALDRMVREHCPNADNDSDCARRVQVTASQFLQYLDNGSSHLQHGIPRTKPTESTYDIMNFQKSNRTGYQFVLVGTWSDDSLQIISTPQWHDGQDAVPESRCSAPCPKGQIRLQESTTSLCCWKCIKCGDFQFVATPYRCRDCEEGMWPNADLDGCESIPPRYLQWTETASIVVMVICSVVMLTTGVVTSVYIRYITTPLIKASSRELSFVILLGILSTNASAFAILAKPTPVVCAIERFMPAFSVATVHAAIFTKTNRIARILAVNETKMFSRKRRFMGTASQLAITGLLILGQAIVSGTMLAVEPPKTQDFFPEPNKATLICNTSELANFLGLSYDFLLIVLCTVYAVKTRNVPENFNEAKMIGFAMYATVVIWIAYLAVYLGSERNRELSLCLAMNVSSFVVLVFLFIPKVYIVIFQPEKNVRTKFLTFKHDIGKSQVSTVEKTTVLN